MVLDLLTHSRRIPLREPLEAEVEGCSPLAGPYRMSEIALMENVVKDLQRDPEIIIRLVTVGRGIDIWTKPSARQRRISNMLDAKMRQVGLRSLIGGHRRYTPVEAYV